MSPTDFARELVDKLRAPILAHMRAMTPLDVDTAVGAIFMVFFLATQLALVMLAREASRLFAVEEKKAEAREEPQPEPAEEPAGAQVAGFAWMRAAGVTHPDEIESDDVPLTPAKSGRDAAGDAPESPLVPPTPFSPASRASSHYAGLSPGELQKLREFRALLERAAKADPELLSTPALRRFCSDSTLCRYLRARQWNLKRALKMLVSSLRWRRATRPESITWEDVAAEGASGKQYVAGRDKQGRNVLVMRPGRENTREHAGNIRFLVYTLEHATWRDSPAEDPPLGSYVDHASEKLVILIDFTGWTLATAPPMKTSRETLSILQDHFPERLAVAVCYNPPWIFAVFWKAISPFIDPETYRKIRFVNPKRQKEMRRMRQMFRMEVIDADMGGERDPRFDVEAFARAARAHDQRKSAVLREAARSA